MAGDWIKMRHDLPEDPAVIAIAAALDLNEYEVVGRLHKWWCWLDRQSRDGNALSVTKKWIDRYVGVTGFADSLLSTGWLAGRDCEFSIPNFERHNGKTAKKRALSAERQSRYKSRSGDAEGNAASVTREEKRRVSPPKSPSGGLAGDKSPEEKPARRCPPPTAPADAFNSFARAVGIPEARPGEQPDEFKQRVLTAVAQTARVAA